MTPWSLKIRLSQLYTQYAHAPIRTVHILILSKLWHLKYLRTLCMICTPTNINAAVLNTVNIHSQHALQPELGKYNMIIKRSRAPNSVERQLTVILCNETNSDFLSIYYNYYLFIKTLKISIIH